jgi:preprotein translocase subunit YajC
MPPVLLISTVIFFIVIMALAMGIPFTFFVRRDQQQNPHSQRNH